MTPLGYDILKTLYILGKLRPSEQFVIAEIMELSGVTKWSQERRETMAALVKCKYVHQLTRWGSKAQFYEISLSGREFLDLKAMSIALTARSIAIASQVS